MFAKEGGKDERIWKEKDEKKLPKNKIHLFVRCNYSMGSRHRNHGMGWSGGKNDIL